MLFVTQREKTFFHANFDMRKLRKPISKSGLLAHKKVALLEKKFLPCQFDSRNERHFS